MPVMLVLVCVQLLQVRWMKVNRTCSSRYMSWSLASLLSREKSGSSGQSLLALWAMLGQRCPQLSQESVQRPAASCVSPSAKTQPSHDKSREHGVTVAKELVKLYDNEA